MSDILARMRQIVGTTQQWADDDLVLADGEIGIERRSGIGNAFKVGNGVDRWSQLPYSLNSVGWGAIYGDIEDQADLMALLDDKADLDSPTFTGDVVLPPTTNIKTVNGNSLIGTGDVVITSTTNWGQILGTLSDQLDLAAALAAKQETLVSGVNIKTVNGNTLLGGGNLAIATDTAVWGQITGTLTDQTDLDAALDAKAPTVSPTFTGTVTLPVTTNLKTVGGQNLVGTGDIPVGGGGIPEAPIDGLQYARQDAAWTEVEGGGAEVFIGDDPPPTPGPGQLWWESDTGNPFIWYIDASSSQWVPFAAAVGAGGTAAWGGITGTLADQTDLQAALDAKQETLVSGVNIKTINGNSLLGSGDLVISGGGSLPPSTMAQFDTALTDGDFVFQNQAASVTTLTATGAAVLDNTLTTTHTSSFATGATASGQTKTINFGTGGVAGSTTTITYGGNNGVSHTMNGNISLLGTSNGMAISTTSAIMNLGALTTTGAINIGSVAGTGTITLGRSTANQTVNVADGATASGNTKTVNIGANGVSGSTTAIAYGSSVAGAVVLHNFYGGVSAYSLTSSINFSPTTGNLLLGTNLTTGQIQIGSTTGTGAIDVGLSTANQTVRIAANATTSGNTKNVQIGTTGASGSTTNITYGSAVSGATVTHVFNAGAERMRIDSAGNVGIGTADTLPTANTAVKLYIRGDLALVNPSACSYTFNTNYYSAAWKSVNAGFGCALRFDVTTGEFQLWNSPTSVAAASDIAMTPRMSMKANGFTGFGAIANYSGLLQAGSPDGVIQFGTQGTTKGIRLGTVAARSMIEGVDNTLVGSYQPLTISATNITLSSTVSGQGLLMDGNLSPMNDNGSQLGWTSGRFIAVYAVNGAIQTSDEREKVWHGAATEAEIRAAGRIIDELGFFSWIDGDDKRHYGARAQAVLQILIDEGLEDPIDFAVPRDVFIPDIPALKYHFIQFETWEAYERDKVGPKDIDPTVEPEVETVPAGNRFSMNLAELGLFVATAQHARQNALEARIAALEAA